MELYVVGSGTCAPSLRRGSPGCVIRAGNSTLLLDSGSGTLRRLLELAIDFKEIGYLFYSHLHPDHTSDLVPFLFASNYGSEEMREKDLCVIGPVGMAEFHSRLKEAYGKWIVPKSYNLELVEIADEELKFTDFNLQGFPLVHSNHSVGFRLQSNEGKVVAYSGDTDYCDNLIKLARGVDLLVLECSFPDDRKVEGHLTPTLAGRVAREAECKRLVLTHFYPPCDELDIKKIVEKEYSGEIILAEDLMKIVV
jgi:ribonuclease BN (tRNA processing enzyme)